MDKEAEPILATESRSKRHHPSLHWFIIGAIVPMVTVMIALKANDAGAFKAMPNNMRWTNELPREFVMPDEDGKRPELVLPNEFKPQTITFKPKVAVESLHKGQLKRGEDLSAFLKRNQVDPQDINQLVELAKQDKRLSRIKPGEQLRMRLDSQGQLLEFAYDMDEQSTLYITKQGQALQTKVLAHTPPQIRTTLITAEIEDSLFQAAQAAGLSERLIMKLVDIFASDIDFALDVHRGDKFSVLYEEIYRNGRKIRDGNILAAEFTHNDQTYRAVRYVDPTGKVAYYTPDGSNTHKAFLRTPVDFARISSGFDMHRRHPILNTIRAHKGVDYAAPTGTAIKAAGAGKVVFCGRQGGYGNVVVLQHGGAYSTLYAHMSRFATGIRTGVQVRQGQVIGYVGSTGLATGPHLHYEFRVNGAYQDPLKMKFVAAEPVPMRFRQDFMTKSNLLWAQLENQVNTRLTANYTR